MNTASPPQDDQFRVARYSGGLVRPPGDGGRWPHLLVLGEAGRYAAAGRGMR